MLRLGSQLSRFVNWCLCSCLFSYIVVYSGYDGQFILNWLHEQAIKPDIITRGLEIIQLRAQGITILDTLNYLPMPLAGWFLYIYCL